MSNTLGAPPIETRLDVGVHHVKLCTRRTKINQLDPAQGDGQQRSRPHANRDKPGPDGIESADHDIPQNGRCAVLKLLVSDDCT